MLSKLYKEYRDIFILGIIAVFVGVLVGAIDTVFGKGLLEITGFRQENFTKLIPFLAIAGVFIIYLYKKVGKNCIKGMTLVFQVGHGEEDEIPIWLIPLSIISTWITHLFGGSAGREGVAVQIGATVAHGIGRKTKLKIKNSSKILLVAGMAAGFAGLFQTPIAAVFFALEVLVVGTLEYRALFPAVIASFTASYTSHFLGLEKFSVALNESLKFDFGFVVKITILGIIFGIIGGLFAYFLNLSKSVLCKVFEKPMMKIFITGIILSVLFLLCHKGRYSGLGTNIIAMSFSGDTVYSYDWLAKFILTIITLAAGFQGGEVTLLFSIGSSLGVVLASILGLPTAFVAALGYASVFGSATNTLIAPMLIGAEVFGFKYLPYFFVTCTLAYIFNGNKSIYTAQKTKEIV